MPQTGRKCHEKVRYYRSVTAITRGAPTTKYQELHGRTVVNNCPRPLPCSWARLCPYIRSWLRCHKKTIKYPIDVKVGLPHIIMGLRPSKDQVYPTKTHILNIAKAQRHHYHLIFSDGKYHPLFPRVHTVHPLMNFTLMNDTSGEAKNRTQYDKNDSSLQLMTSNVENRERRQRGAKERKPNAGVDR